ncbi:MAG TPA: hypothetical protein VG271_13435 [Beijerinckiaceae bacterium]|jgi:hypothetical protein|nr:hypothetical protein [Beijerinckiaceae bacterium]
MHGFDQNIRTSLMRVPSTHTADERQRAFEQELLDNHRAVVVRLDEEPGCWSDRMLFARGRIVVIRLEKLLWLPVFVAKYLRELAASGWKRKGEEVGI